MVTAQKITHWIVGFLIPSLLLGTLFHSPLGYLSSMALNAILQALGMFLLSAFLFEMFYLLSLALPFILYIWLRKRWPYFGKGILAGIVVAHIVFLYMRYYEVF